MKRATADAKIRPATDADIAAITAIYAYHVRHGTSSFEIDAPDAEEIARRRSGVERRNLPYFVAEFEGAVAGYAYAGAYRPRAAYRFTVENSVYVHPAHLRRGLGRLLLRALIDACEQRGCRQMIAVIGDSANAASIRLYESFGFRHAGVLQAIGFKFGRWLDTVLMQLPLGNGAATDPGERNF
jgi:phosphinothricin acetyltransferase